MAIRQVEVPIKSHGLVEKMKLPWKKRRLCFLIDEDGEIDQEWFAVDIGTRYILCETAGLQVCYEIPKPLIELFMKEKKLSNVKLSCA
jgi:hypothetical protein